MLNAIKLRVAHKILYYMKKISKYIVVIKKKVTRWIKETNNLLPCLQKSLQHSKLSIFHRVFIYKYF